MKRLFISCLAGAVALCLLLTTLKLHRHESYSEHLWTSAGKWRGTESSSEMLLWERREYGRPYAWLVWDQSLARPNIWHVRLEPRSLMFYLFMALAAGAVTFLSMKRRHPGSGRSL